MAKKKTKKKKKPAKKKAKRKPAKKKHYALPRPIGLQAKILKIMKLVPTIECTGQEQTEARTGEDPETYYYTEAAEVFRQYSEAMVEVGLTFVPITIVTVLDDRAYRATVTYRLTDVETGQFQDVVAVGLGCNGVWALNSAQTVARKQALLNMFGASYPQPKTAQQVARKAVKMFQPFDVLSSGEAVKEMDKYFSQEKPNENASDSRKSVRSGKRPAKGHTGKDNPAKTGRSKTSKTD
ncbi:MAG: hypothetical protein V3U75_04105 [Methylococcaceae bacterium]